jgi:hypothetical protein
VLQSFTISVAAVNDAPEFTTTPVETGEANEMYDYFVSATDEEEQAITLTCPTKPAWLSFSSSGGNGHLFGEPPSGGSYDVVVSATDGTNVTTQPFTIVVSGLSPVNEIESSLAKVYPVPASDFVRFDFEEIVLDGSLKIFSMDGKLVMEVNLSNQKTYILDLSRLNAKEYIYNITSDNAEQKGKILIK